ncbi:hypothetical protein [Streptomyces sp. N2A]|uniref:hypothetical protein n=1 Tax=Streptomyces sp. N2A TaxID=3073936 RepID=UPI0028707694|nr:hypothetical protein [Streptomyces sp. N2A]
MSNKDNELRVGDDEFMSVTRDPAMARVLRKQLEALADGKGGDVLAEMAREVLSGRIGLREAVRVGAYEEELVQNVGKFQQKWDEMSAEERSQAEKEGARFLEEQRAEIEQERRERARETQTKSRHSVGGFSLY